MRGIALKEGIRSEREKRKEGLIEKIMFKELNHQKERKDEDIQNTEVILDAGCNKSVCGEL